MLSPDRMVAALDAAKWDGMERDVVVRLRALRLAWEGMMGDGQLQRELVARDLYFPALDLLRQFCEAVDVVDEKGGDDDER